MSDEELVQKDAFNAVLFKDLIVRKEYVVVERTEYRRFYNPMLNCFSEDDSTYGSHYYDPGIKSIYWYFFDQVIVRKSLVNRIERIEIIKAINNPDTEHSIRAYIPAVSAGSFALKYGFHQAEYVRDSCIAVRAGYVSQSLLANV